MESIVEMPTQHGEPVKLLKVAEDILVSPLFSVVKDNLQLIADIEPRKGDILICSFPKSGTHWTNGLVRDIVMRNVPGDQVESYKVQRLGLLENITQERLASALSQRIFSTHLRPRRIPTCFKNGKGKIVLVVRNPKDVAVSLFFHMKNATVVSNKQDWNEFFDSFTSGVVPFGQYLEYINEWEQSIKNNNNLDIEVFYYENFKRKGLETVKGLAKHLGFDLTDEEVQSVLDNCSIEKMSERDSEVLMEKKTPLLGKDGKSVIYRKGEIGDWKNHFTVAQNEYYDEILINFNKKSTFAFRFD